MPDLYVQCNANRIPEKDFTAVYCKHCRQPKCDRAEWRTSSFDERIATQEERLLNPLQADPSLPKYAHITQMDFKSMLDTAIRLELADRRGDWEVPDLNETPSGILLPPGGTSSSKAQPDPVEQAVSNLSQLGPVEVKPENLEPILALPEQEPEEPQEEPSLAAPPLPKGSRPPVVPPKRKNTVLPAGGLMVGGGPPTKAPVEEKDPWTPSSSVRVVKPGARIRLGSSTPPDSE